MTPEERVSKIMETIWFWLPARWTDGSSWFEISNVSVVGDETTGGSDVSVRKNDADPVIVHFTNDEIYGTSQLSVDAARARITGV